MARRIVLLVTPPVLGGQQWWVDRIANKPHLASLAGYVRDVAEPRTLELDGDTDAPLAELLDALDFALVEDVALVGISCWTSLHYRGTLAVAAHIRQRRPDLAIVVGGHHPTAVPADFDERSCDVVVKGDGEHVLRRCAASGRGDRDDAMWWLYCHFHLTKNAHRRNLATVETLRDAGIGCQVALSMQDFDDDVLTAIKRENISLEQSLALRRACNERGIPTYNELILGLPAQTYASFCTSIVKAITPFAGDSFFLYLCRLLENAEMAEPVARERYGIETRSCPIGDFHRPADTFDVVEREEIVVKTRAMPNADWRRAYRFGYLVSALYNYRLLDVVIHYLRLTLGIELRLWVDAILDRMAEDSDEGVMGELHAVFSRYIGAIMNGDGLALKSPDDDGHLWSVSDAVLATALRRRREFFEAVHRDYA